MNSPVINWVIALKPEAQPLIAALELKQRPALSKGGFAVYENADQTHRLIISGIGKVNSAAAVSWLGQWSQKWHGWINLGIAGHQVAELGSTFRAGRITDGSTLKSWYPTAVWPKKEDRFEYTEIITVDKPTTDYPTDGETVEMEASGFVQTALRFGESELVQVIKVISDNEKTDIADLNPTRVTELISAAIPDVIIWSQSLANIAREEMSRLSEPEGWQTAIDRFRFSETEKHQLKRLIMRALALDCFESANDWLTQNEFNSGKEVLRSLESLLSNTETAEN